MTNTYVDAITYQKAPTGLQLASQIGNIGRIGATTLGATSLTLVGALTTADLYQYDAIYITDGPNSEALQVGSGGAAIGATSIPLQSATAFAHAGGTPYVTDGTQGSLGQSIFEASRWIEDICHQSLYSTAYTGEILTMPTMRAAIDNERNIHFRPRHFPIATITSISLQDKQKNLFPFDPTKTTIDSDQQTVDISLDALLSSQNQSQQGYPWINSIHRKTTAWLILTYTAGFAISDMPWAVTRTAVLLTSAMFAQLTNAIGADDISQGKRKVTFTLRGDPSGESLLVKEAMRLISPYIAQSF